MRTRLGFTLIELLIVIAVIAILASMILMGASALWGDAKKKKTDAIIAAVNQGLELYGASKGGTVAPAEHPLACSGSAAAAVMVDTYEFYMARPSAITGKLKPTIQVRGFSSVASAVSLVAPVFNYSGATSTSAGCDDDLFASRRVPLLYGVQRKHIGLLGAVQGAYTQYWKVTLPLSALPDLTATSTLMIPQKTDAGTPADNKKLLSYVFFNSNAMAELAKLKAVRDTASDTRYTQNWLAGAVKSDVATTADGDTEWKPGLIQDKTRSDTWKAYKPLGLNIYDAWDNELLYSISATGRARIASAGKDGAFIFAPHDDKTLQTDLNSGIDLTQPLGPQAKAGDRDGTRDNVLNSGINDW